MEDQGHAIQLLIASADRQRPVRREEINQFASNAGSKQKAPATSSSSAAETLTGGNTGAVLRGTNSGRDQSG